MTENKTLRFSLALNSSAHPSAGFVLFPRFWQQILFEGDLCLRGSWSKAVPLQDFLTRTEVTTGAKNSEVSKNNNHNKLFMSSGCAVCVSLSSGMFLQWSSWSPALFLESCNIPGVLQSPTLARAESGAD